MSLNNTCLNPANAGHSENRCMGHLTVWSSRQSQHLSDLLSLAVIRCFLHQPWPEKNWMLNPRCLVYVSIFYFCPFVLLSFCPFVLLSFSLLSKLLEQIVSPPPAPPRLSPVKIFFAQRFFLLGPPLNIWALKTFACVSLRYIKRHGVVGDNKTTSKKVKKIKKLKKSKTKSKNKKK